MHFTTGHRPLHAAENRLGTDLRRVGEDRAAESDVHDVGGLAARTDRHRVALALFIELAASETLIAA